VLELGQRTLPFNRPWRASRELQRIQECLKAGKLSGDGPFTLQVRSWLEKITGAQAVLLTTSCTSALELAALLLDTGPGDEVIMPSFTFVSTANPFCLRGAVPVFADIDPATMNMDSHHALELVTRRTRAFVPVHYAGVGCAMEPLLEVSRSTGIAVVEDAAQGIGATRNGRALGSEGVMGAISFHETKNIGCGEGGALLVNDRALVERALVLREKGTNRSQFLRGMVDKYTWVDVGSSFLSSDLLAALLLSQLEELELITASRRRLWQAYHEELSPLMQNGDLFLPDSRLQEEGNGHIFWMLAKDEAQRDALIEHLRGHGIAACFHYVPLHLSPMGRRYGGREGLLPVTESVAPRLLRLPLWAGMQEDDARWAAQIVREFFAA